MPIQALRHSPPILLSLEPRPALPVLHGSLCNSQSLSQSLLRQPKHTPCSHEPLSRGRWCRVRVVSQKRNDAGPELDPRRPTIGLPTAVCAPAYADPFRSLPLRSAKVGTSAKKVLGNRPGLSQAYRLAESGEPVLGEELRNSSAGTSAPWPPTSEPPAQC